MDIVAKHIPADKNGVRIAELDEMKFRRELWSHPVSYTHLLKKIFEIFSAPLL